MCTFLYVTFCISTQEEYLKEEATGVMDTRRAAARAAFTISDYKGDTAGMNTPLGYYWTPAGAHRPKLLLCCC